MTRNLEGQYTFITMTTFAFRYVYDQGHAKNAPWPIHDVGVLLVVNLIVLRRNNDKW